MTVKDLTSLLPHTAQELKIIDSKHVIFTGNVFELARSYSDLLEQKALYIYTDIDANNYPDITDILVIYI